MRDAVRGSRADATAMESDVHLERAQPVPGPRRSTCSRGAARRRRGAAARLTYFLPLWNLTMFAPQYPDGLRLDIYSHTLVGGTDGQDVKEINVLNHYIGMHDLPTRTSPSSSGCRSCSARSALLFLRAAVHGKVVGARGRRHAVRLLRTLLAVVVRLQALSLRPRPGADGGRCKVPPFMPPMFGYKQIANFEVYSYPQAGHLRSWWRSSLLVGAAFVLALRDYRRTPAARRTRVS